MTSLRCIAASLSLAAMTLAPVASAAPPGWIVDKAQSHLTFETVVYGEGIEGTFKKWDAQITLDPKKLAAATMHVTVDVASVESGNTDRDTALPSETWFDVARFATATFDAKSIEQVKPGEYTATGTLTLRGVSKPLVLPFRFDITGNAAHMTSAVDIDRTAFGIGGGEFASADAVAHEVTIKVDLRAKRAE